MMLSFRLLSGESLEEKWTYSLALQAATWGAPLVTTYLIRYNLVFSPTSTTSPNMLDVQKSAIYPSLSDDEGFSTPCLNLFYGAGWSDLRVEPCVIILPDSKGLYYSLALCDAWSNCIQMLGGRATGFKGGKFMLAGPSWNGETPPGVTLIRAPGPWGYLLARAHIYENQTLNPENAIRVLDAIQLMGLSQFLGLEPLATLEYNYPSPVMGDPSLPISDLDFKDPLQFWDILMRSIAENPPPQDQIDALMPLFAPLGLISGNEWDPTGLSPIVIAAMKKAAMRIGNILPDLSIGASYQGVELFPPSSGRYGTDYKSRAVLMRNMDTINVPYEAIYWEWLTDSRGEPLVGTNRYTLTFKEPPAFIEPGFWSVTMYDDHTNNVVPNVISRYMIGSDTKGLKKNKDGSITIYIQSTTPGRDKESNWLPSIASPFYMMGRVYIPTPPVLDIIMKQQPEKIPPLIFVGKE